MRKLDNKGLSLLELLIAIAVMALLLSPIMLQLIQSVNLSGQAKERQYVTDSANETIEYIRKYDQKELVVGDNEGVIKVTNKLESKTLTPADPNLNDCALYDINTGKCVAIIGENDWHWIKYTLEPTNLGKKNQSYTRYAVQSDLLSQISALGYSIDYNQTRGSSALDTVITDGPFAGGSFKDKGFVIRSDNTIVRTYDGDYNDDSKITAIVVSEKPAKSDPSYTFINPNETSIGDIQDIDANKMAIIPGDATMLDYQVESDMKSALIQFAAYDKVNGGSSIFSTDPQYEDPSKLNDYIVTLLSNPANVSKTRNIHVTVTAGHDTVGPSLESDGSPKFYRVRCDVTYQVKFNTPDGSFNSLKIYTDESGNPYNSNIGKFSYTVLDRKYYTNVPPNIYMIYEPLITQTATGTGSEVNVSYAADDYITISTDKYTSGYTGDSSIPEKIVNSPSKLYLIRSTKNWQKVVGKVVPGTTDPNASGAYYTTTYGSNNNLVNIIVNQKFIPNTMTEFYCGDNPTQGQIDIYTNIGLDNNIKTKFHIFNASTYGSNKQFSTGHSSYSPGTKLGDDPSNMPEYTDGDVITSSDDPYYTDMTAEAMRNKEGLYDEDLDGINDYYVYQHIKSVYDEEASPDGRLFKVTVVYKNSLTEEETYITGAKGAN